MEQVEDAPVFQIDLYLRNKQPPDVYTRQAVVIFPIFSTHTGHRKDGERHEFYPLYERLCLSNRWLLYIGAGGVLWDAFGGRHRAGVRTFYREIFKPGPPERRL